MCPSFWQSFQPVCLHCLYGLILWQWYLFVFAYLQEDRWISLPQMPTPRAGAAVAVLGKQILVVGGVGEDQSPVRVVEMYNIEEGRWRRRSALREALMGVSITVKGTNYCLIIDDSKNRWNKLWLKYMLIINSKAYPLDRHHHTALSSLSPHHDHQVFVCIFIHKLIFKQLNKRQMVRKRHWLGQMKTMPVCSSLWHLEIFLQLLDDKV